MCYVTFTDFEDSFLAFTETSGLYIATIFVNLSKTMVIHHVEVILKMEHSFRGTVI
jgi:hypothetical protein